MTDTQHQLPKTLLLAALAIAVAVLVAGCSFGPDSNDGEGKFVNVQGSKAKCVKLDLDEGYWSLICDYQTLSGDQCYITVGSSADGVSCFERKAVKP